AEGMLALQGDYTRYLGVEALMKQPVLDPTYVSVADFVRDTLAGKALPAGAMTPLESARLLEHRGREALRIVEPVKAGGDVALEYEVADLRAWARLGLHLAEKLRGAVALATFRA